MLKLCKNHYIEHAHKICKNHNLICEIHKKETGHERGIHGPSSEESEHAGESVAGNILRYPHGATKENIRNAHKTVLGEMKQIRPNLVKAEEGVHLHDAPEDREEKGMQCPDHEDNRHDNCQYCQDLDAVDNAYGTAGMTDDCPMCREMSEDDHSNCPYCEQMNQQTNDNCPYCTDLSLEQANPATGPSNSSADPADHTCNCPHCPTNDGSVAADDAYPSTNGPADCPECQKLYEDAQENQPGQDGGEPPKTQGHETAEEVLNMLDQEGQGKNEIEAAKKIENTELPQGDQMKDGTSVKENFGDAQKEDVSDEEKQMAQSDQDDQPDMADVLRGGLDDHANEQKRAQVIDQVAQTLQGFKANKEFLESAKEQSPGLYQSTIQMLKAMISLCDLLGLKPQMSDTPQPSPAALEAQTQSQPAKPQPAAPKEGAASGFPKKQAG